MLDCDGDVNSVDDRGNTPLHCLCSVDHSSSSSLPDCISLLVSNHDLFLCTLNIILFSIFMQVGHGASVTIENNAVSSPT